MTRENGEPFPVDRGCPSRSAAIATAGWNYSGMKTRDNERDLETFNPAMTSHALRLGQPRSAKAPAKGCSLNKFCFNLNRV